jgi:hypothetical protein
MSKSEAPPEPKKSRLIAFERLDGKPKRRRRGRHAIYHSQPDPAAEQRQRDAAVPLTARQRLGFRIPEFSALFGISRPTVWRGMKSGEIEYVKVNGVKIITREFAVRKRLIAPDQPIT